MRDRISHSFSPILSPNFSQFQDPAVDTYQVQPPSSSHFATNTISVHSNLMFIKTTRMLFTHILIMDQPLEEGMISIFHTMSSRQRVIHNQDTHTVLHLGTAIPAVIPKHYWLAVIVSVLLKLKFIIFHECHVTGVFCV